MSLSLSQELRTSPKRFLLKLSPRRSRSAPVSPKRQSSLSNIYNATKELECQWDGCVTKKSKNPVKLDIKNDKFLAVKCTCFPSKYFCSKRCHRAHWISKRCHLIKFNRLSDPLSWDDKEFVHLISKYNIVDSYINANMVFTFMDTIFLEDIYFEDLNNALVKINEELDCNLAIIPKRCARFRLAFVEKKVITVDECIILVKYLTPFFTDKELLIQYIMEHIK